MALMTPGLGVTTAAAQDPLTFAVSLNDRPIAVHRFRIVDDGASRKDRDKALLAAHGEDLAQIRVYPVAPDDTLFDLPRRGQEPKDVLEAKKTLFSRVQQRVALGGHAVADAVVRRRYESGWRNFTDVYRPLVDQWALYDNAGSKPQLLEEGGNP